MQPLSRLAPAVPTAQQPFAIGPEIALNQPQPYSGEQLTKAQRDAITQAILRGQFPSAGVPT